MKDDMAKPRRALPPADAPQAETQAAAEPTARGWAPASGRRFAAADEATKPPVNDEAPAPSTDGPVGRRHMATTDEPALTTPVPPPVVTPRPAPRADAGRRFSTDDRPASWSAMAPRRSAASPSHYAEVEPPSPRTTVLPAVPGAARAAGPLPKRPLHVRLFWPVVAVAVVAAIALAVSLVVKLPPPAEPTPSTTTRPVFLIEAQDAASLGGGTWTATSDINPDQSTGIRCIQPTSELAKQPLGGSVVRRTLTASTGTSTIVQQQETYADEAAATEAFAARSSQLGGCPTTADLVTGGYAVKDLADQAVAVTVRQQDDTSLVHDLVLTRTGSTLMITDAQAGSSPFAMKDVVPTLAPALGRVCAAFGGTCPGTTPSVSSSTIPASDPPGYLSSGDLPLVTTGVGKWLGAQMLPMKVTGSGCEGISVTKVSKAKSASQRSFVLEGDPDSSSHFGLDEIVYTFGSDADAKAFSSTVIKNIKGCETREQTATVKAGATLPSPANGQLFTVDQLVTVDKAARTRVIVASSGKQAVYIAANPTAKFDLTDAEWLAVGNRALTRAKQLP